jgi:predicted AlkP superfamily phosphohydrolase/phosphomutase
MIFAYIDPGSGFTFFSFGAWIIAFLIGFFGLFLVFFRRIWKFLIRFRGMVAVALIAAGVVSALIIGAHMGTNASRSDTKVIILGFDGLSPAIIEPMMAKGELPHFARLERTGSYRTISTTNPSQSPVAWTGFSTGQNPGKNGIFDFIKRDPATYRLDLSLSNIHEGKPKKVVKSTCFWEYTSEKSIPATIIACPITFPPDKIHGRMLSGMGVPDMLGTEGTFTFYTSEPLEKERDIGGKVFSVAKSDEMTLHLIGPRVASAGGKTEHTKVPFSVRSQKGKGAVTVTHNKKEFELVPGQWSEWQEVVFKLGLLKNAKGIFKFYLVETDPAFKLYISPINFDPRDPLFTISHPPGYAKELADRIGLYYTQGMPMDTWSVNEKRLTEKPFLEQVHEVLREKRAMLDLELGRFQNGVLYCYFESPDIIQHMFWRYTDPEHPLYEKDAPALYKNIIRDWYKEMDNILGSVMERISADDTLLVMSDHGFDTFRRAAHVNSWLRKEGFLELKNPNAESGAELLYDIDWSKTKAYAIGFGAVYINEEGRERSGIVRPGREKEDLKRVLAGRLKEWRDEKYGKNIVHTAYPREEIFWGEYAGETPDLYIGFAIGYRASWQTALGGVPGELVEDNLKKWSGSHLFDPALIPGVLFSNKIITKESPSIYDLAPTILKITGFTEEELETCDFDGKPLF